MTTPSEALNSIISGKLTFGPGPFTTYTEHCKHCPAYRRGRQQPDIAWSEPILPTTEHGTPG